MLAQWLSTIVNSRAFQNTVIGLILLAAVVVGLETDRRIVAEYGQLLHTLDWLIIWAFVAEALMKMGAHGRRPWRYFRDPWNCFDFTIVVLCFVPATGQFAAVVRLARVLRTLRLITAVPRLQILVSSLLRGLPSMMFVGLLLLMLFYVYAVMGVFLFRENDPFHFGHLGGSMLTLFRVVTLEDWTDVLYAQMYGTDVYPAPGEPRVGPEPRPQPLAAVIYFVSFVLVGTIVMLNLVIGVIISAMEEAKTERDRATLARERASEAGLSASQEIQLLEHQMDEIKRHLHVVRARLDEAEGGGPRIDVPEDGQRDGWPVEGRDVEDRE